MDEGGVKRHKVPPPGAAHRLYMSLVFFYFECCHRTAGPARACANGGGVPWSPARLQTMHGPPQCRQWPRAGVCPVGPPLPPGRARPRCRPKEAKRPARPTGRRVRGGRQVMSWQCNHPPPPPPPIPVATRPPRWGWESLRAQWRRRRPGQGQALSPPTECSPPRPTPPPAAHPALPPTARGVGIVRPLPPPGPQLWCRC